MITIEPSPLSLPPTSMESSKKNTNGMLTFRQKRMLIEAQKTALALELSVSSSVDDNFLVDDGPDGSDSSENSVTVSSTNKLDFEFVDSSNNSFAVDDDRPNVSTFNDSKSSRNIDDLSEKEQSHPIKTRDTPDHCNLLIQNHTDAGMLILTVITIVFVLDRFLLSSQREL